MATHLRILIPLKLNESAAIREKRKEFGEVIGFFLFGLFASALLGQYEYLKYYFSSSFLPSPLSLFTTARVNTDFYLAKANHPKQY